MEPNKTIPESPAVTPITSTTTSQGVPLTAKLPDQQPEEPKSEGFKGFLSTLAILIAAPLIALALTAYVFQTYEVDGPSMQTTLENHDRLLVLKLPKTIASIMQKDYHPARDEIIIFKTSAIQDGANDMGQEKQLVKRVIGVPGDRVLIQDGVVTIYNAEFPEGFNPDKLSNHGDYADVTSGNVDVTVKPGEVFVLGDHRNNSLDSRAIGTIPDQDIIGELVFRLYPLSTARSF